VQLTWLTVDHSTCDAPQKQIYVKVANWHFRMPNESNINAKN